ncbi:succinylglutamate desuccinylase [Vibrio sp. JC009]|uniref:succinylglutamate desuccinylase n=1 Tax=Vibrio sp. JC009 TaxID=2912314 RepID=UPI0023B1B99E|nr:succinylglutamate desuccinylase [Vibrio sp. JC009]WED23107.1 succinylglutamate desuccinylase [Vibrio sp. JC009]
MVKPLFRQSFLFDSLDIETEVVANQVQLPSGLTVRLLKRGLLEVVPQEVTDSTKSIVVSVGVHGDETAPMEMLDSIVSDIIDGRMEVKERCLFMLAHPKATHNQLRYIDENLNRLFDMRFELDTAETKLAQELTDDIADFFKSANEGLCWHLDLHCAIRKSKHFTFAVSPKTTKKTRSHELFSFVEKAKLEAILLSNAPAPTFSWYSADKFGAQALTVELGQIAPLGQNNLELIDPFEQALRALLADSLEALEGYQPIPYRVTQTIRRTQEDFDFNFSDDVENFTRFEHGQVIGHDGDKLLFAKVDHEAVVFPNKNVELGHRAALMVCEVETRYENDQLVYD